MALDERKRKEKKANNFSESNLFKGLSHKSDFFVFSDAERTDEPPGSLDAGRAGRGTGKMAWDWLLTERTKDITDSDFCKGSIPLPSKIGPEACAPRALQSRFPVGRRGLPLFAMR
jgi:hypothetical protein